MGKGRLTIFILITQAIKPCYSMLWDIYIKVCLTYLRDLEVAELKEEDMVYAYHYGRQFVK